MMEANKTDAKKKPFSATFGITAEITLTGELDANSATIFQKEVENAVKAEVKRLVLFIEQLEYMASAGLRVLIFAKQKMGAHADIYIVGGKDTVLNTLKTTGFADSVIIQPTYKPIDK